MRRRNRIDVPGDLASLTARASEATTSADVEYVWRGAEKLFRTGVHPAIALCVRQGGDVVLDRTVGWAKGGGPGQPESGRVVADPATPFCIFSASKAITAIVIHHLDDQGLLHVDDRVAEYIPEFAQNGKGWVTLRHVLTHRAGIPSIPAEHRDLELLLDWDQIVRILCEATPVSKPGRRLQYHAITGGFVLGEIVKRVTGRDIRTWLHDEVLEPLGFEWMNYGVDPARVPEVATNYFTGPRPRWPISPLIERGLGASFAEACEISNSEAWLTSVVPSGNIVSNANELSRFFELLLREGELGGTRVFSPRTIRRARQETAWLELDLTLMMPVRYGTGLMLGSGLLSPFGPGTQRAFGHLGFINCFAWADVERDVSVALLTNGKPFASEHLLVLARLLRRISRAFAA